MCCSRYGLIRRCALYLSRKSNLYNHLQSRDTFAKARNSTCLLPFSNKMPARPLQQQQQQQQQPSTPIPTRPKQGQGQRRCSQQIGLRHGWACGLPQRSRGEGFRSRTHQQYPPSCHHLRLCGKPRQRLLSHPGAQPETKFLGWGIQAGVAECPT